MASDNGRATMEPAVGLVLRKWLIHPMQATF
jgi:hypothetical protein